MLIDIVFPENNEAEFIAMANRLGYDALVFIYFGKKDLPKTEMKLLKGIVVDEKTSGRPNMDVVLARMPSRQLIERLKPDIIYELEQDARKDYMHQRNSGLDHINAAICNKRGISVGFSFASLFLEHRPRTIGRMKQNMMLCRKYKLHMTIGSFARSPYMMRSPQDLASLFITLGMHQKEAKEGLMLQYG
jgi:hypothetical protein